MKFSGFHSSQRVGLGMEVISSSPYVTTPASLLTLKSQGTAPILASQRSGASTIEQFVLVQAEGSAYTAASGTSSGTWTNIIENKNSNLMLSTYVSGGTGGKIILDADNVGIGTTNPTVGLQVGNSTSGETQLVIFNSEGGVPAGLTVKARTNRAKLVVSDNDSSAYVIAEGGKASFGRSDSLSTNNITVQTDGRVGIGTTAPYSLFSITQTSNAGVASGEGLRVDGASGGFAMIVRGGTAYTTSIRSGLTVGSSYGGTAPPSDGVIISGKVGIGTTAPDSTGLHIGTASTDPTASYTGNSQLVIGVPGGSTHKLAISRDTDGDNAYIHSYQDGTGAKNLILQPGGGKVGIGNASPASMYTTTNNLVIGDSGNSGMTIKSDAGIGTISFADGINGSERYRGQIAYSHSGDSLRFNTAAAERIRITSDGKVGIGTASPSEALHVVGKIKSTSNWISGSYEFANGVLYGGTLQLRGAASSSATVGTTQGDLFLTANIQDSSNYNVKISPSGSGVSYFSTGYVGIGNTSPNSGQTVADRVQLAIGNTAQVGGRASGTPSWFNISHGTYFDGTNWKYYSAADEAALVEGYNGGLYARMAVAGTNAGDNISWVTALTVLK